jgi:hypothetical protein
VASVSPLAEDCSFSYRLKRCAGQAQATPEATESTLAEHLCGIFLAKRNLSHAPHSIGRKAALAQLAFAIDLTHSECDTASSEARARTRLRKLEMLGRASCTIVAGRIVYDS